MSQNITISTKSTTVFNIDNNNTIENNVSLANQHIKLHKLKTGVMILKIQLFSTGINYIWKYIQIGNSYFNLQ